MTRLKIWALCVVSLCISVAINYVFEAEFGLNLFSIILWRFVPVGAMAMAFVAGGGFVLGATRYQWRADRLDLLFLMVICVSLQILIVVVAYWAMLVQYPNASSISFARFFERVVTSMQYTSVSRQFGVSKAAELGEAGWLLVIPRIGCLLAIAKVIHSKCGGDKPYLNY